MLQVTRAIVLRTIRHGDRSIVLRSLTERFGPRTYMVRTGARNGIRPALLEPLSRLELVVTEDPDHDMHHVREVRAEHPYLRLMRDPVRAALVLFTQEVLYNSLRQDAPDPDLFRFVSATLDELDGEAPPSPLFPQFFLLGLSHQLGFFPAPAAAGEDHFDPREGHFLTGSPAHVHGFDRELSALLAALLDRWPEVPVEPGMNTAARKALLEGLLLYFRFHLPEFGELRSPAVLHAVLHG
jgi:DNA repair protein RecO (recombination protein O)